MKVTPFGKLQRLQDPIKYHNKQILKGKKKILKTESVE